VLLSVKRLIEERLRSAAVQGELVKLALRLIVEEALEAEVRDAVGSDHSGHGAAADRDHRNRWRFERLKAGPTSTKPHRSSSIYWYAP
jgi:putative transposase